MVRNTFRNSVKGIMCGFFMLFMVAGIGQELYAADNKLPYALDFNGTDAYIDAGHAEAFDATDQITVEAWFLQREGQSDAPMLIHKSPTKRAWHLKNPIIFLWHHGPPWTANYRLSQRGLAKNRWHHVAAVHDGTEARLYVNGRLKGRLSEHAGRRTLFGPETGGELQIGAGKAPPDTAHFWNGKIAEVRLWNVARTQEQIQNCMNKRLSGDEKGLVGYWPLNEGEGDIAHDRSGNGNHGKIVGAEWTRSIVPPHLLSERPPADTASVLLQMLRQHPSVHMRCRAVSVLAELDTGVGEVVPVLLEVLKTPDEPAELRLESVKALRKLDASSEITVSAMLEVVNNRDEREEIRVEAVRALGDVDAAASRVAPALLGVLEDNEEPAKLRTETVKSLRSLDAPAGDTADVMQGILRDADETDAVRKAVVGSLSDVLPVEDAASVLFGILKSAEHTTDMRVAAADALQSSGQHMSELPEAVEAVSRIAADPRTDLDVRLAAVNLHPHPADLASRVVDLLKDSGQPDDVRWETLQVIKEGGSTLWRRLADDRKTVDTLQSMLSPDNSPALRTAAVNLFNRMGLDINEYYRDPLVKEVNGRMQLVEDRRGDRIPDFSWAGYKHSSEPIPDVDVVKTVEPSEGNTDDTERIQQAIDEVSERERNEEGFRGAVLLKAGQYRTTETLVIEASGVVLRGEGRDEGGTTIMLEDGKGVEVKGTGKYGPRIGWHSRTRVSGTRTPITQERVAVGSRRIEVKDASAFKPGDMIVVHRNANWKWIDELSMRQTGWGPNEFEINYERVVQEVNGNTLTIDAPIVLAISDKYGGGSVYKAKAPERIEQSGVEFLRIAGRERFACAVSLKDVNDCWVRGVTSRGARSSAFSVGNGTIRVTIMDCANFLTGPPYQRRYIFSNSGQQNLFLRCLSRGGRHDFVQGARTPGPNAFVDCLASHAYTFTESHNKVSSGLLYDNVRVEGPLGGINVASRGTRSHGWNAAWGVLWNSGSQAMIVMDPPTARNLIVGSWPRQQEYPAPNGARRWFEHVNRKIDWIEGLHVDDQVVYQYPWSYTHHRERVKPRSLFFHQLEQRLGEEPAWLMTEAERKGDMKRLRKHLEDME